MEPKAFHRKLTAILSADVAGYSRLMQDDEVATVKTLAAYKQIIFDLVRQHRGRVVDSPGDNLLAEFASVVDSVLCAVSTQKELQARNAELSENRRMKFRIGVNLGDVIEEGDRIYGDGVNIAARLEALAEPGGIFVSRNVFDQVRDKLSFSFEDIGEQTVKNIARPIGIHRINLEENAEAAIVKPASSRTKPNTSDSDQPTLAVLPFVNMSGDPEQEYFADGISEDIITGLSKLRWFFVIARNSSFTYKGKAVDVKRVARELGVRYVLEGSVRKGGNRVRITTQMIDAATGNHLWASRYDGDLTDVFALQDEITQKVVAAIEPKLLEAEGIRSQSRSPEDLDAWDMVIRANTLFWRLTTEESEAAIGILKRAVERFPDYAPAHSMLAFMLLVSGYVGCNVMDPQVKQAAPFAARAAQLDDSDPWAHLALGLLAFFMRRTDEAEEEFKRALDLNPNFAAAHGYLGYALAFDDRSDQALDHLELAIRMSPHDPQNAVFNVGIAVVHYLSGRFAEALRFGRKALQQRSGFKASNRICVASLAQAGQIDEARALLARLKEIHPDLSIAWIEKHVPYTPGPMVKFIEGMRKAGLE
jgi:TolB-like protein/class 3 adenylate cyclase